MAEQPARARGRSRGGLGKYLRARGRRGGGRPAEFGNRLLPEEEQEEEDSEDADEVAEDAKYAKRELHGNAHRYEEPKLDPRVEQEEPEVDLSSFLERQRLAFENENTQREEEDDGIDHTLSNLPSSSSRAPNSRKNKTQIIQSDSSFEELKREKEAAEAIWDLKSRFRKNQTRHTTAAGSSGQKQRGSTKVEGTRQVQTFPKPESDNPNQEATPESKADLEEFLDDLLR